MKEMTIAQYAKSVKLTRFAIYKQIEDHRLPDGVSVKNYLGRLIIVKQLNKVENEKGL
jgi:hypothetical protein